MLICFNTEYIITVHISTWHVSTGNCLIRLCFTNFWLELKTSDDDKENGAVVVLLVLFFLNENVLQRKMLRSIVGWVRLNGEDWSDTMRRMNHRLSAALELFPIPPWTEQLAKRQFLFAAKIASEQSWSSIAGHWICTTGWQANFDNMPSRKRGRPLVKWDDKLSKITEQYFPPQYRWLTAAKMPSWQNARHYFVSHFVDL